jgi:hypothetical protein
MLISVKIVQICYLSRLTAYVAKSFAEASQFIDGMVDKDAVVNSVRYLLSQAKPDGSFEEDRKSGNRFLKVSNIKWATSKLGEVNISKFNSYTK